MIRRSVKIQLVLFVILAIAGISYTGAKYVGFNVGANPYKVTAYFKDSGGIFTGAEVTDRGVNVGRVGSLRLVPQGVAVELLIDPSHTKIPADTKAAVGNLSAVGEQYVDLQPQSETGPYLADGSKISVDRTSIPLDDATLLLNLDKLVNSVDREHLATVISELGTAFKDTGPDVQRLIDSGNALTQAAQQALPETVKLIDDGKTVLDTQRAVAGDIRTFADNLASLSQQIVASDSDIRRVFDGGIQSSAELQKLLNDNRSQLPVFLSNFVTLGQIQAARIPGLESLLVLYPANVANGYLASAGGYAHFGLVAAPNPNTKACTTGYESTKRRTNRTGDWNGAANLNTYCTSPDQGGASNPSGSDVRGAQNAPRPAGDSTATNFTGRAEGYNHPEHQNPQLSAYSPSGAPKSSTSGSSGTAMTAPPGTILAPYDPLSGLLLAPNGQAYILGDTGGQQQLLGDRSWEWLLLAPAAG